MRYTILTLLMFAGIGLCACAGKQDEHIPTAQEATPRAAPGSFELAPPSSLAGQLGRALPLRGASYVPADLVAQAELFNALLPNQLVSAQAGSALFAPDWPGQDSPFSGLAFAMYGFAIPGYGGNSQLRYSWKTAPPDPTNLHVGLANWDEDRWDWYQGNALCNITPSSLAPYFKPDGSLLACVLKVGTASGELDWLAVGSKAPQPGLSATPRAGVIPFSVNFDASGSSDPDGTIAEYRWDPEGDGSFDVSTGTDPHFSHDYAAVGAYQAAVRVTDDKGVYTDQALQIQAVDSINFTWGSPDYDESSAALLMCDDGNLLMVGQRSDMSVGNVWLTKLSVAAEPLFSKVWDNGGNDYVADGVLGPDGYVYTAGATRNTTTGVSDALLQKWTQDGQLVWSRALQSGIDYVYFRKLIVAEGKVYACGDYNYDPSGDQEPLMACFDTSGQYLWARTIPGSTYSKFNDLAYYTPEAPGDSTIRACGFFMTAGDKMQGLYAELSTAGDLLDCRQFGDDATNEFGESILLTSGPSPSTVITGMAQSGTKTYVSTLGGSCKLISGDVSTGVRPLSINEGGATALSLLLSRQNGTVNDTLVLCDLSASLGLVSWQARSAEPDGDYEAVEMLAFGNGRMLIGGGQTGPMPGDFSLGLQQTNSSMTWQPYSATAFAPVLIAAELPLALADVTDCEVNRPSHTDMDAFVYVGN